MKRGQRFYLNQIDLRTQITATVDEGVRGLRTRGDFAGLAWDGITKQEEEFVLLANPDGTFRRRRFFRDAVWMRANSEFSLEQIDHRGHKLGNVLIVETGVDHERRSSDGFFDRRLRAIQWTNDCRSERDCTGAKSFEEEALVELRYGEHPDQTFSLAAQATALRLSWSLRPGRPYVIPLTQVAVPRFAYGVDVAIEPLTRPRADGSYAAGSDITFRVTLRDGEGTRLHPSGALPTYNEVVFGANPSGLQYYRAFFDPTTTYWRRKHRERMMMAQLIGPAQRIQPVRTILELEDFLAADDVQVAATLATDGVFSEVRTFPTAHDLFGGAFDAKHAAWDAPVPDTWTHHLPADAVPGTYLVTVKGRRTFLGEDIPYSRTIEIQVGSPARTQAVLTTGPCDSCHSGPSALGVVLHGNANRGACAGCHVPLGFELEGPIFVRTHFIHSRSRRFEAPLTECAACHLTPGSIQRTSKAACLSCHTSYPRWHQVVFGPIQSIYVGGGRESFKQCTSACHRTHPNSRL
ncbi:MAG: cytochrome C [Myxococcales bacterium]|nr:cytochrome C [Myxococcales bacterium]